jgi:hypothetical protein
VEVERGKFVGIALYNDSCHGGKMFRDDDCTLFHYENVLGLHLLKEFKIAVDVVN